MEQMSLKDIAALLDVKAYRVEYLLAHGLVPEPKLRISGRRVFTKPRSGGPFRNVLVRRRRQPTKPGSGRIETARADHGDRPGRVIQFS